MPIDVKNGRNAIKTLRTLGDFEAGKSRLKVAPLPRMVMHPFDLRKDKIFTAGGATAIPNGNITDNNDNTQSGVTITLPADPTFTTYVVIRSWKQGNVLGVRMDRGSSLSLNIATPLGAFVDRQPIAIPWSQVFQLNTMALHQDNGVYRNVIFGADFGPGEHEVAIVIPCDRTVQKTLTLNGWLLDESEGYKAYAPGLDIQANQLTVTANQPYLIGPNSGVNHAQVGFYYSNPTASPITVKVRAATTLTVQPLPLQTFDVAAGKDGYFALPGAVYDGYQVDANGPLVITPVGLMQ